MTIGVFRPTANQGLAFGTRQRAQQRRAPTFWTPARVAELCERYGSREGFVGIARDWATTRNALIGKWTRLINETAEAAEWEGDLLDAICDALADEMPFETIAQKLGVSTGGAMAAFAVLRRQIGAQAR